MYILFVSFNVLIFLYAEYFALYFSYFLMYITIYNIGTVCENNKSFTLYNGLFRMQN